jgi:hypothetical protein
MINKTPNHHSNGKAFWDVGHAPKDQSNRGKRMLNMLFERFIP